MGRFDSFSSVQSVHNELELYWVVHDDSEPYWDPDPAVALCLSMS